MRQTRLRFPLSLVLQGEQLVEQEVEPEVWSLYDPRFLLPWLSHLCSEVGLLLLFDLLFLPTPLITILALLMPPLRLRCTWTVTNVCWIVEC